MALPTLAGLPLELKQEILKYVLIADEPIYIKPPILQFPVRATFPGQKSGLHPGIIAASKIWTVEALNILYSHNTFFFKSVHTIVAFTASISRRSFHMPFNNRDRVKHVCLAADDKMLDYVTAGYFTILFPNLETVDLNRYYYDEGQSPMRDVFMDYLVKMMKEELRKQVKAVVTVVHFVG
ncbi:hypothetical protein MMC15_002980 [Xylographa vitiligo]|nr:hypothetical protein [Xylographa vitiligo]